MMSTQRELRGARRGAEDAAPAKLLKNSVPYAVLQGTITSAAGAVSLAEGEPKDSSAYGRQAAE